MPEASSEDPLVTAPTQKILTRTGLALGTPAYMAPEQFDSRFGAVGSATDVWALGVILHELLTGSRPFKGEDREECQANVCGPAADEAKRPARLPDRHLGRIVRRCCERDPENRYPNGTALADALAGWQRDRQRRRAVLRTAGIGVVLLAALAGLIAVLRPPQKPDPHETYLKAVKPALAQLERGEKVTVVEPGRLPTHFVRGEGATRVRLASAGLNVNTMGFAFIEFLPRVPVGNYRIVVEMQHILCTDQLLGGVGVYCRGNHIRAPAAEHALAEVLRINDHTLQEIKFPNNPRTHWRLATFKLQCSTHETGVFQEEIPYRRPTYSPDANRAQWFYEPSADKKPDWWKVTLDIEPGVTQATLASVTRPKLNRAFGSLQARDWNTFIDILKGRAPNTTPAHGFKDMKGDPAQGQAIGIVVTSGRCLIRRFDVVPLE